MKKSVIVIVLVLLMCSTALAITIKIYDTKDVPPSGITPDEKDRAVVVRHVYGLGHVADISNGEVTYYSQDRLGSTRVKTDSEGEVVGEFKSLPFGQEVVNRDIKFAFTGKELDSSGLYYFGARYYDPNLGRFTSVDPVGDNHPYSYVNNNPMNYVDPSGMDPFDADATNVVETIDFDFNLKVDKQYIFEMARLENSAGDTRVIGAILDRGLEKLTKPIMPKLAAEFDPLERMVIAREFAWGFGTEKQRTMVGETLYGLDPYLAVYSSWGKYQSMPLSDIMEKSLAVCAENCILSTFLVDLFDDENVYYYGSFISERDPPHAETVGIINPGTAYADTLVSSWNGDGGSLVYSLQEFHDKSGYSLIDLRKVPSSGASLSR